MDPKMKHPTPVPDVHRRSLSFLMYLFTYLFRVGPLCSQHHITEREAPPSPVDPRQLPPERLSDCRRAMSVQSAGLGAEASLHAPGPTSKGGNGQIMPQQMPGKGQSQASWHHHPPDSRQAVSKSTLGACVRKPDLCVFQLESVQFQKELFLSC